MEGSVRIQAITHYARMLGNSVPTREIADTAEKSQSGEIDDEHVSVHAFRHETSRALFALYWVRPSELKKQQVPQSQLL